MYKSLGRPVVHAAGERWYASRLAYHLQYGPFPRHLVVAHDCDNPLCVRPDHLFLATWEGNHRDMVSKGRQQTEHLRGWRNPKAAPRDLALAIRQAIQEEGLTRAQAARRFGVSFKTAASIVGGTRYRNL